jgi:hypothetical protein
MMSTIQRGRQKLEQRVERNAEVAAATAVSAVRPIVGAARAGTARGIAPTYVDTGSEQRNGSNGVVTGGPNGRV